MNPSVFNDNKSWRCPICFWDSAGHQFETVPYPTGENKTTKVPEKIVFCKQCGVGIAFPLWTEDQVDYFYNNGQYWQTSKTEIFSAKQYPVLYALSLSRWKLLEPFLKEMDKPLSVLDIGAGQGFFGMAATRAKNIRLASYTCVEKDNNVSTSLRRTWLSRFPHVPFEVKEDIASISGKFNCIIISQVLEHVVNPLKMLAIIKTKLMEEGLLFIDVPNQDYLFKKDVFPHLLFFNPSSMSYLLELCGIHIELIRTYGNDMVLSIMNYNNKSFKKQLFLKAVMKLRFIFPESVLLDFVTKYFEMNKENENGVWIRTIGRYQCAE